MNLKERIRQENAVLLPGVFDALSARVASQQDFEGLYMSGFAVAASLLGEPDIGLVTASEMVDRVRQIVNASGGKPVIADGDNGHGGVHNVARLVQAYEQAGASCIQLEDQVIPKRCGHMENKEVVDIDEAAAKIASAVSARKSKDFLIMARTDSRATHDLNEALKRGEAFLQAGADILFIEAPQSIEEMKAIRDRFPDTPLVANMVEDGKTPLLTLDELANLGYKIVLRPVSALLSITKQLQLTYGQLQTTADLGDTQRLSFSEMTNLLGLPHYLDQ